MNIQKVNVSKRLAMHLVRILKYAAKTTSLNCGKSGVELNMRSAFAGWKVVGRWGTNYVNESSPSSHSRKALFPLNKSNHGREKNGLFIRSAAFFLSFSTCHVCVCLFVCGRKRNYMEAKTKNSQWASLRAKPSFLFSDIWERKRGLFYDWLIGKRSQK